MKVSPPSRKKATKKGDMGGNLTKCSLQVSFKGFWTELITCMLYFSKVKSQKLSEGIANWVFFFFFLSDSRRVFGIQQQMSELKYIYVPCINNPIKPCCPSHPPPSPEIYPIISCYLESTVE